MQIQVTQSQPLVHMKQYGMPNIKITQLVKQKDNLNFEHTINDVVFPTRIHDAQVSFKSE